MYEKSIRYDRETHDYACYLDVELMGFERNYHAAEVYLDQLVFELLNTPHTLPAVIEEEEEMVADDWEFGAAEDALPDEDDSDDDYADAMAEQAMGTYNGKVPSDFAPSTCCFCQKPHAAQSCPAMRARLFAPDTISAPLDVDFAPIGFEV